MANSIARRAYLAVRNVIMERSGLQPRGVYSFSLEGYRYDNNEKEKIILPNLSGELRPIIRQYIDTHGLGDSCLLVSENSRVRAIMEKYFPKVRFLVSDLHTDLMNDVSGENVDYIWDVCSEIPDALKQVRFNSIISQSLLEHTIAPTVAVVNFLTLLEKGGYLYLSTHTPSFHYHAYPRDYVRFHHDYFYDLPAYIANNYNMDIELVELYSFQGVICVCFNKK